MSNLSPASSNNRRAVQQASFSLSPISVHTPGNQPPLSEHWTGTLPGSPSGRRKPPPPPLVSQAKLIKATMMPLSEHHTKTKQSENKHVGTPPRVTRILTTGREASRKPPPKPQGPMNGSSQLKTGMHTIKRSIHNIATPPSVPLTSPPVRAVPLQSPAEGQLATPTTFAIETTPQTIATDQESSAEQVKVTNSVKNQRGVVLVVPMTSPSLKCKLASPVPDLDMSPITIKDQKNDQRKNAEIEGKPRYTTTKPKPLETLAEPRERTADSKPDHGIADSKPDHGTAESETKDTASTHNNSLHSREKSVAVESIQKESATEWKPCDLVTESQTQCDDKLEAKPKQAVKPKPAILPDYMSGAPSTLPQTYDMLSPVAPAPVTTPDDPSQQLTSRKRVRGPKPAPPIRSSSLGRNSVPLPVSPSVMGQKSPPKKLKSPDDMNNPMRPPPSKSKVAEEKCLSFGNASHEYEPLLLAMCDDSTSKYSITQVTGAAGVGSAAAITNSKVAGMKSSLTVGVLHEHELPMLANCDDSSSEYAIPQVLGAAGVGSAATLAKSKVPEDKSLSTFGVSHEYEPLMFTTCDDSSSGSAIPHVTDAAALGNAATMTKSKVVEEKSLFFKGVPHEYQPLAFEAAYDGSSSEYTVPQVTGGTGEGSAATMAKRMLTDEKYLPSGNSTHGYQLLTLATRDDSSMYMQSISQFTGAAGVRSVATMPATGNKQQSKGARIPGKPSRPPFTMGLTPPADDSGKTVQLDEKKSLPSPKAKARTEIKSHPQISVITARKDIMKTKCFPSRPPPLKLPSSIDEQKKDKKDRPLRPAPPKFNRTANEHEKQAALVAKPRTKVEVSRSHV